MNTRRIIIYALLIELGIDLAGFLSGFLLPLFDQPLYGEWGNSVRAVFSWTWTILLIAHFVVIQRDQTLRHVIAVTLLSLLLSLVFGFTLGFIIWYTSPFEPEFSLFDGAAIGAAKSFLVIASRATVGAVIGLVFVRLRSGTDQRAA